MGFERVGDTYSVNSFRYTLIQEELKVSSMSGEDLGRKVFASTVIDCDDHEANRSSFKSEMRKYIYLRCHERQNEKFLVKDLQCLRITSVVWKLPHRQIFKCTNIMLGIR